MATSAPSTASFEALYHGDRLQLVNPTGDVGIVTLWSPWRTVERKLAADAPELLDPARSRVAVIANLYGDGMYAMFCNLLYNPQVRHLIAIGQDLGLDTTREIAAFLADGLEDAELLGRPVKRIRGMHRVFPAAAEFDDARLRAGLSFHPLGKLSDPLLGEQLTKLMRELPRASGGPLDGAERIRVPIPTDVADADMTLPSEVGAHQVVRPRPLDCWDELVVRAVRFGRRVELRDGPRLELLNAKAVITDPAEDPRAALAERGFELDRFHAYQRRILQPELPEGISYTYGNRLRGHFELGGTTGAAVRGSAAGGAPASTDTLQAAIDKLRADPRTRGAYVSLWDTAEDLPPAADEARRSKPCLTTLFFRTAADRLTLTATYRAHNLLTAWLENVYGLIAIQRHVANGTGIEPGAITVISHSLGIDPRNQRYELARTLAQRWTRDDDVDHATGKTSLREDPNGYFVVSPDPERRLIVAEHRFGGVLLKRYEAARAVEIEHQVAADMAVTLVSHALWLGHELARAEQRLRGSSA
ncbi:thymidylate synthase [Conexibacter sp. CPCC 206217]|uniref:thymidylate synthase n=1 Tax=Conexibacter sp. CPCC 206217 TaxID=3064574 RepID=UPI00272591B1|nr:thymidylate synthase [Conexibacter sp. CPCC 206217]MDO8211190.1 thymidylate synthase [Conexibacter sp. CPCC 206217]